MSIEEILKLDPRLNLGMYPRNHLFIRSCRWIKQKIKTTEKKNNHVLCTSICNRLKAENSKVDNEQNTVAPASDITGCEILSLIEKDIKNDYIYTEIRQSNGY